VSSSCASAETAHNEPVGGVPGHWLQEPPASASGAASTSAPSEVVPPASVGPVFVAPAPELLEQAAPSASAQIEIAGQVADVCSRPIDSA
jgi:hypothetical protein